VWVCDNERDLAKKTVSVSEDELPRMQFRGENRDRTLTAMPDFGLSGINRITKGPSNFPAKEQLSVCVFLSNDHLVHQVLDGLNFLWDCGALGRRGVPVLLLDYEGRAAQMYS
jgi:hypothetical protein